MDRIILWNADQQLEEQIKNFNCEIIANLNIDDEVNKIKEMLPKGDKIIIPYAKFRETKAYLKNEYGIENVYTIYEYKVLGQDLYVKKQYADMYDVFSSSVMKGYFYKKNVVIIGGGSGIGKACAEAFVKLGANVLICGRSIDKLKKVQKLLSEFGSIKYIQWFVDKVSENEAKIQECEMLCDGKIDILVNSAGYHNSASFFTNTEETFCDIFDINIKGLFFVCQSLIERWLSLKHSGHIVNILSIEGFKPSVNPYGLSKWAGRGFTQGLGEAFAEYGIIVNGIAPAEVATEFIGYHEGDTLARRYVKTGRITLPEEVASMVVYLASFMGKQLPGKIIEIDGGDNTIKHRIF